MMCVVMMMNAITLSIVTMTPRRDLDGRRHGWKSRSAGGCLAYWLLKDGAAFAARRHRQLGPPGAAAADDDDGAWGGPWRLACVIGVPSSSGKEIVEL